MNRPSWTERTGRTTFRENEQENVLAPPWDSAFLDEWPFLSIRNLENFHQSVKTNANPTN